MGVKTYRIHKKCDGLLLINSEGNSRYLTFWESIGYRFGLWRPCRRCEGFRTVCVYDTSDEYDVPCPVCVPATPDRG